MSGKDPTNIHIPQQETVIKILVKSSENLPHIQNPDGYGGFVLVVFPFMNKYIDREVILFLVLEWLLPVWLCGVGFYCLTGEARFQASKPMEHQSLVICRAWAW